MSGPLDAFGFAPGESSDPHSECVCNSESYECGTYTCSVCGRTRPWCLGSSDELEDDFGPLCDACWCVVDAWLNCSLPSDVARKRIDAIAGAA